MMNRAKRKRVRDVSLFIMPAEYYWRFKDGRLRGYEQIMGSCMFYQRCQGFDSDCGAISLVQSHILVLFPDLPSLSVNIVSSVTKIKERMKDRTKRTKQNRRYVSCNQQQMELQIPKTSKWLLPSMATYASLNRWMMPSGKFTRLNPFLTLHSDHDEVLGFYIAKVAKFKKANSHETLFFA
ncbi:hypothetical protein CIPAW_03G053400 [Carya illinoinensis]|uniref:Uncharacterized protein n=1 Tax=Carya illinoinensis TaxID=32201 RepID=A0A8T1QZ27_CARIL|nr:hypothetical protein CIPAW_03G053400 [Carya illinoinensis]